MVIENDGIVLELKAFAGSVMGPGPSMVGVRAVAWGVDDAALLRWSDFALSALDRLTKVISRA